MTFFKNIWNWISNYLFSILLWLDEGINVWFVPWFRLIMKLPPAAGNAHYTVSQTFAELRERGSNVGCVGCKILTVVFSFILKLLGKYTEGYDHCTEAMNGVPEDETEG